MAKQYFIWNNANPNEWAQITGQEFYALVNSESAQKRYFIHIPNQSDSTSEPDDIYIEASRKQYQEYLKERNHADYLSRHAQKICTVSLEQPIRTHLDDEISLHEILPDQSVCVADEATENITRAAVQTAMQSLSKDELELVEALFIDGIPQGEFAVKYGVSQQGVSWRKKKIIKKLKKLLVESEKSQQ